MTDLTGQTIDQYQLIELIHRGENTVYKGFQASMNRYVAVKVLNPALAANPAFVQAFPQNMQRITALQHPNILPIYDYGQQGELFYIVSQYIETGTLKDRLPPAFSPQQAQAMLNPIVDALDQAYPLGVGYGNINPSNILINAQGRPLLTDLGYIQGIDTGGVENIYLSPEQHQGAVPDSRSDVYALGILLYHMLVGEPPAVGTAAGVRTRRPELLEAVERVILTATAPAPEQRFQTPNQLRAAFNQALPPPATAAPPPQAVPQPPASPPASTQKSKKGGANWLIFLVGGLLAVCCLLGVLGVFFAGSDRDTAAPPPDVEEPAPEEPTPPSPDGSLLQGLFDMIAGIFDGLADIIDSILGGGAPPSEPTPEPPGEQPLPEEPPPAEQLPAEPEAPPAEESGDAGAE
jgi:serine/threonine protein kinase